jgi:hypothetical protein
MLDNIDMLSMLNEGSSAVTLPAKVEEILEIIYGTEKEIETV